MIQRKENLIKEEYKPKKKVVQIQEMPEEMEENCVEEIFQKRNKNESS